MKQLIWPVARIGVGTVIATWAIISAMLLIRLLDDWKYYDLGQSVAFMFVLEIYVGAIVGGAISLAAVVLLLPWMLAFNGLRKIGMTVQGAAALASGSMSLFSTATLILFGGGGRLAIPYLNWQFVPVPVVIAMGLGWKIFGRSDVAGAGR